MSETISLDKARSAVLKIWIAGSTVVFVVMIIQTLRGAYEVTGESGMVNKAKDIWGWFIPLILPSLSLMISAFLLTNESGGMAKKNVFTSTLLASAFYLFLIMVLILGQPFFSTENPMDTLSNSNFFMGPLQGIVVGLITYLFSGKAKLAQE